MPETRDVIALQGALGTLAKEFGARPARATDAAAADPRLQLGEALERLYAAINDLHQGRPVPFQQAWSPSTDATFATPGAGVISGIEAVRTRIERDAQDADGRTVVAEDVAITLCLEAAWAVCTERATCRNSDGQTEEIRQQSTNIFRRESGAWRLVHRHVGPVV